MKIKLYKNSSALNAEFIDEEMIFAAFSVMTSLSFGDTKKELSSESILSISWDSALLFAFAKGVPF